MANLGGMIHRIAHKMNRKNDKSCQNIGVSAIQAKIIGFVRRKSKHTDVFQKDIEDFFELRGSSVTSTLKNLEKTGYILREVLPNDQRLKRIVLTQKALDIHNQIMDNIMQVEAEAFSCLTDEEKNDLELLLEKILSNIENY